MSQTPRDTIASWFHEALASVDPTVATTAALDDVDPGTGKLVVVAIGKAALPMAQAARCSLGPRIDTGLFITKQGQLTGEIDGFVGFEAGHPVPTEASLYAGQMVLEAVCELTENDTVLALISGGGSALVEYPIDGVSLTDLQVTTELLMFAGAGIHELNAVRKSLSQIKGGGFRRAMGNARCVTLLLSDVLGNDHGVIASGLTVLEACDLETAWRIVKRFGLEDRVPESVRLALLRDAVPIAEIDASRDEVQIIADNHMFVQAVVRAAANQGYDVHVAWSGWTDTTTELGQSAIQAMKHSNADVLIGGGEATSIVRGSGKGGRNTETALGVALAIKGCPDWTFASLASDGDDGSSHAAGAIVDGATVVDEVSAQQALLRSDSAGYLAGRDALLVCGPTGTNVNDVYVALRNHAINGEKE